MELVDKKRERRKVKSVLLICFFIPRPKGVQMQVDERIKKNRMLYLPFALFLLSLFIFYSVAKYRTEIIHLP